MAIGIDESLEDKLYYLFGRTGVAPAIVNALHEDCEAASATLSEATKEYARMATLYDLQCIGQYDSTTAKGLADALAVCYLFNHTDNSRPPYGYDVANSFNRVDMNLRQGISELANYLRKTHKGVG